MDEHRTTGLDGALERLINEPGFRDRVAADPQEALTGYDLSTEDLAVLATAVGQADDGEGASGHQRRVEARHSKAGMLGLFAPMAGGGRGGPDELSTGSSRAEAVGFNPQPDPPGLPGSGEDAGIIIYGAPGEDSGIISHGEPGEDSGIIIIGGRDGG